MAAAFDKNDVSKPAYEGLDSGIPDGKKENKEEVAGLDSDDSEKMIKLVVAKKNIVDEKTTEFIPLETFTIPRKYALISDVIKMALEQDENCTELPLTIASEYYGFNYVIEYMNIAKGKPQDIVPAPLLYSEDFKKNIKTQPWMAEFIERVYNGDVENLYNMCHLALYLNINCLLHLACARIAGVLKKTPLEKIKDVLTKNGTITEKYKFPIKKPEEKKEEKKEEPKTEKK